MLHKTKSSNKNQLKYVLLILVVITFITLFNARIIAQENEKWEVKVNIETVELIIEKNYSDALLAQEVETFKNEYNIDLSFKGIKRNAANEITAIKIEAKGTNIKASFQNKETTAINPIKISFDKQKNTINIGNLDENHFSYSIQEKGNISIQGNDNKNINYVFISSDNDVNTWTSKNDTIVNSEKIIINNNGKQEVIWVEKKRDSGTVNVEVIELNEDANGNKMIFIKENNKTIEIQEDNASENVYIIKNTSTGKVEQKTEKVMINSANSKEKPLIILNGEQISSEEMEKIKPDNIESINVLKGESATKKYGDKGKNGVIEIIKKQ